MGPACTRFDAMQCLETPIQTAEPEKQKNTNKTMSMKMFGMGEILREHNRNYMKYDCIVWPARASIS